MAGEALQLGEDHPSHGGPRRNLHRGQGFHRLAEGQRIGEALVPRNTLRHEEGLFHRHPLAELFYPLVHEKKLGLQVDHRLPRHAEAEMPGFDDPGVNRTHGNFVDPRPLHFQKGDFSGYVRGPVAAVVVPAQGMDPFGPMAVEHQGFKLGMTLGDQAEEVGDLSLVERGGGDAVPQGGEAFLPRRQGSAHHHEGPGLRGGKDVSQHEAPAFQGSLVRGKEHRQGKPQVVLEKDPQGPQGFDGGVEAQLIPPGGHRPPRLSQGLL
ncbi:MAG: hypothetical protein BWY88_00587 [Synergistetes bacterium ADurb.Bin520]|nr:MAG: hypothetical protein BWY88_00587 [Synergistetes bacterium ADurb.Bin520]